MKKKLASFILSAALVLSLPVAVSAAEVSAVNPEPVSITGGSETGEISPASASTSSVGATRHGPTSGSVSAYASFSGTASKAVCSIFLQEKYNGSWRTATGVPVTVYVKTAYNTSSIAAGKTFTLVRGKVYRAKVIFTDTINGVTYAITRYTGAF